MAVYILHFERKYRHAGHYVGFTKDFERRRGEHLKGGQSGSPLVKAAIQAGITIICAIVWQGAGREQERRIKASKNTARFCPICRAAIKDNHQLELFPRPNGGGGRTWSN
jgi:predicted GIY-YIG superfamily endonuclease